jgi:IS30 family transposase
MKEKHENKKLSQFTREERSEISILKKKGYSYGDIAGETGRAKSAIWNEIHRNKVNKKYDSQKANHKAYVRRKYAKYQGKKIVENIDLKKEIGRRLPDGQSPKAIGGWLRRNMKKKHGRASKNAVYRYIASIYGRRIETQLSLRKKKYGWRKRRGNKKKLSERTFIDRRPRHINERRRIGDAEADFILPGRSGTGILLTTADRKSRTSFIEQILQVTIPNVHRAFVRVKKRFPELKTVTTDNDLLFERHKELEKSLGIKIYFCRPYHSREKGTIENTSGVVRKSIPKSSGISKHSKRFVEKLEAKLNRRPMEVIGFRTPQEMLDAHRKHMKKITRNKKRLKSASF